VDAVLNPELNEVSPDPKSNDFSLEERLSTALPRDLNSPETPYREPFIPDNLD